VQALSPIKTASSPIPSGAATDVTSEAADSSATAATAGQSTALNATSSSPVPPAVLPHVLLQQLQQMEAQLNKAKQLVLPIVGAAALRSESVSPPPSSSPQTGRRPSVPTLRSFTPQSANGGRKMSLRSPSITSSNGLFSPAPNSARSATGSASRRPSSARRGSLLLDANISLSESHHTGAPLSARKFIELNQSHSRTIGASGKLDRSSPLVRNVDLSIFKSPLNHKRPEPRNKFDNSKLTWVPDARSSSSVKAKERFQSTKELMVAREVNPVFFNTDL
jgi:hypothetical protein